MLPFAPEPASLSFLTVRTTGKPTRQYKAPEGAFLTDSDGSMAADGEPLFVAADVCRALEIDPTATRRLDEDEKMTTLISNESAATGKSQLSFVNEPGLYSLVLGSRKFGASSYSTCPCPSFLLYSAFVGYSGHFHQSRRRPTIYTRQHKGEAPPLADPDGNMVMRCHPWIHGSCALPLYIHYSYYCIIMQKRLHNSRK